MQETTNKQEIPKVEPTHSGRMQVISLEKKRFERKLNAFMTTPLNSNIELKFISSLYTMLFYVPVQVEKQVASQYNRFPGLKLDIATMTYLADGNEYIPVFSSFDRMDSFMRKVGKDTEMRPMVLSTKELMFQAQRTNLAGILINPGEHNFPLSNEYWNYVRQIQPINLDNDQSFKLKIMPRDPTAKIEKKLSSILKRMRTVKSAWLLGIKLPNHEEYEYVIIVNFIGDKQKFEELVARKLALSIKKYLPRRSDVLIGTTDELVGRSVVEHFKSFYERKVGLFG